MLVTKLILIGVVFLLGFYFSIRLIRRGLSKKYEPKSPTHWNALTEGIDPTVGDEK